MWWHMFLNKTGASWLKLPLGNSQPAGMEKVESTLAQRCHEVCSGSIGRRQLRLFWKRLAAVLLCEALMLGVGFADTVYLSDRPELIHSSTQGWGTLGLDQTGRGEAIEMAGKIYTRGIGHHASGSIIVMLNGGFTDFQAEVGVQSHPSGAGSVVFQVFLDGRKAFDSGVVRQADGVKRLRVAVDGVRELRLLSDDAGDGNTRDMANWAEARLTVRSNFELPPPVDVSQFARVVTWDPNRTEGASATRVEEFDEADLFLETDLVPSSDGDYVVPQGAGLCCIGLQWLNRWPLKELSLQLSPKSHRPPVESVRVEYWTGESAWQGKWMRMEGKIEQLAERLVFSPSAPMGRVPTQKIRWVLDSDRPLRVQKLSAASRTQWGAARLRIVADTLEGSGEVKVDGGELGGGRLSETWNLRRPINLSIRFSHRSILKSQPTVLQFRLPTGTVAVSVDDVLEKGPVYLPVYGLFIASEDMSLTLEDYKKQIQGRKTILERVREMPDQTFAQAMSKTHNPVQANGPVMLSLAGDNSKFVVEREGLFFFDSADTPRIEPFNPPISVGGRELRFARTGEMQPRFGRGPHRRLETGGGVSHFAALAQKAPDETFTRELDGGWLPIPVTSLKRDGILFRQRTFVAPVGSSWRDSIRWNHPSVAVVEFTVTNTTAGTARGLLGLNFLEDSTNKKAAHVVEGAKGFQITKQSGPMAWLDASECGPMRGDASDGTVSFEGDLPPGASARFTVYFPGAGVEPGDLPGLLPDVLRESVAAYWRKVLESAIKVEIPDKFLQNVVLSSQVRCLIAARNEADGQRLAPWISAMRYGPLESEAHAIIRAMDFMGHTQFARDGLKYYIHRYNPAGFLTTGYTTFGTAWHLWTLGEHHRLNRDAAWLQEAAPEVARVGQWAGRQTEKTKKLDALGQKKPEYGLFPPGVLADWNSFACHFMMNAYYHAGLREAGRALSDLSHPAGEAMIRSAAELQANTLRAYRWTQSQTPAMPLQNGTWVEAYPSRMHSPGRLEDFFPGEDMGRSWCYDVELGAHQLVPTGLLDADSPEVRRMMDQMEDHEFLGGGWYDYPAEKNRADWFNLGGFSKVQPYYTRNAEIYAQQDDVKPFLRSYFNSLASLLNPEILTLWEHFHNRAAWDKVHETAYFLEQTRFMLVMERGEHLWLAPLIPANWLENGKVIAVENAPTCFGKVTYRVESHVARGFIEATIHSPGRRPPEHICLRLRHPEGKSIRAVTVDGKQMENFSSESGVVFLNLKNQGLARVIVEY